MSRLSAGDAGLLRHRPDRVFEKGRILRLQAGLRTGGCSNKKQDGKRGDETDHRGLLDSDKG
jgi:hypothetical protein